MQVFSCEYCEILKNTYFQKHLQTTTFLYGAVAHDSETMILHMGFNLWFL